MNTIHVIAPYKWNNLWVFDDPQLGIYREPFVTTFPRMLDKATAGAKSCKLLFSEQPFPGCQYTFEWRREELKGNYYYSPEFHTEGWLCPVLLKYFKTPPKCIYVQLMGEEDACNQS